MSFRVRRTARDHGENTCLPRSFWIASLRTAARAAALLPFDDLSTGSTKSFRDCVERNRAVHWSSCSSLKSFSLDRNFTKLRSSSSLSARIGTFEKTFFAGDFEQETDGGVLIRSGGEAKYQSGGDIEIIGGISESALKAPWKASSAAGVAAVGALTTAAAQFTGFAAGEGSWPAIGGLGAATAAGVAGTASATYLANKAATKSIDGIVTAAQTTASRVRLKSDKLLLASGQSSITIKQDGSQIAIMLAGKNGIKISSSGVEIIGALTAHQGITTPEIKIPGAGDALGTPPPPPAPPNPPLTE